MDIYDEMIAEIQIQKDGWKQLENDPNFDPTTPKNNAMLRQAKAGYEKVIEIQDEFDNKWKKFRKSGDKIRSQVAQEEDRLEKLGLGKNFYTSSPLIKAILEL